MKLICFAVLSVFIITLFVRGCPIWQQLTDKHAIAVKMQKYDEAESLKWFYNVGDSNIKAPDFDVDSMYKSGGKIARKSAESGDAVAQRILGIIEQKNERFGEAVKWYRKAAEQGDVVAQRNLAYIEQEENKNLLGAAALFKKAAEQNDGFAQFFLGMLYEQGIPNNDKEAYKWYQKSASQGNDLKDALERVN